MLGIVLIAHNLRSAHNVGSLLRTAEGLGISKVYLTGYTPYPALSVDSRLPYLRQKQTKQIHKTALGAEILLSIDHKDDVISLLNSLKKAGYQVCALEQAPTSTALHSFKPQPKLALLVGREVEGIEPEILAEVDNILEIPMRGQKESFNVTEAAAMALYYLTHFT